MADYRVGDFKDLVAWKRGMELVKAAYLLTRKLPREESYALTDQIRRCAVSIPSNIAEGYGRTGPRDYARFLAIARGSSYELETQIRLCVDLGYLTDDDIIPSLELINEVAKILTKIIQRLGDR